MPTYWDAYYYELALEREAARQRAGDPCRPPWEQPAHGVVIWLICVAPLLGGLAVLARLIA